MALIHNLQSIGDNRLAGRLCDCRARNNLNDKDIKTDKVVPREMNFQKKPMARGERLSALPLLVCLLPPFKIAAPGI